MWNLCKQVANGFNLGRVKSFGLLAIPLVFVLTLSQAATAETIVKDGIKVDFKLMSPTGVEADKWGTAGSDALFHFNITDGNGAPVSGAYPAAWMNRRAQSIPSNTANCKNMVKSFIGGSLLAQPTLNLNTYYVLVMNDDATLSVVDPLFHFGGTNLLTMVSLSSPGFDWSMSETQQRLYVSLPQSKRLAVVDTTSFIKLNELVVKGVPGKIALQPDEQYLWIAYTNDSANSNDDSSGVLAFNTQTQKPAKHFELSSGKHHFAFTPDNRYAFVANQKSNDVTVIDVAKMQVVKTIATAKQPVAIAYASAADAVYVTHTGDGKVVSINARTLDVNNQIVLDKGIADLKFAPNGRHAVVVNPLNDKVYIIDSLNDTLIKEGKVDSGPDQVNFSDTLAYIRHRDSETILMLPMDSIINKDISLQVVDFPGGESGFGLATTPAAGIVQAPGENAVLVAHPTDQQIYYYKEGMAAPMGSFRNFGRNARAVIAVDRSLQEQDGDDGLYRTVGRLSDAGTYDVAFFMESPRVIHCFEVRVKPNPDKPKNRHQQVLATLLPDQQFAPGKSSTLRFRLVDGGSGEPLSGLKQLEILSVLAPGMWKSRSDVTEIGQGVYRVSWEPPQSGAYYIKLKGDWSTLKMLAPGQMMIQVM